MITASRETRCGDSDWGCGENFCDEHLYCTHIENREGVTEEVILCQHCALLVKAMLEGF